MSLGPLMVDVAGTELTPEDLEVLAHPLVGSVLLFTRNYRNPAQLAALCAAIRAVRSPHLVIAVGCTGGKHRSVAIAEHMGERYRGDDAYLVDVAPSDEGAPG